MPTKTTSGRAAHGGTSHAQIVAMATHKQPYEAYDEIRYKHGRFFFKPYGCPMQRITKAQAQNQFIRFFVEYYEVNSKQAALLINH